MLAAIKAKMVAGLLYSLIRNLLSAIKPEDFKGFIDTVILDPIERYVESTPNKWDDLLLLPIKQIREVLDIPDNDV